MKRASARALRRSVFRSPGLQAATRDYTRRLIGNPPSLAAFFAEWSKNKGEFLRYDGDLGAVSHLTYAEAASAALGFAQHLRNAGIQKGDRIVFWGENRPEWVVALWA